VFCPVSIVSVLYPRPSLPVARANLGGKIQSLRVEESSVAFRGSLVDPGADVVVDSFFGQLFTRSTLIVALRDVNGRFVRVSRRLARLFAAVGTDPVGRTVFDVLPADMANLVYYHDQQAL